MQTIPVLESVLLTVAESQDPPLPPTFSLEWNAETDACTLDLRGRELLGLSDDLDELSRRELATRVHADDLPHWAAAVLAASPSSRTYRTRYRFRARDGDERLLEEQGVALFDADGRLMGSTAVVADVTAQELRHRDLRAKENALNAWLEHQLGIMDRIPAMIMLFDPSFQLVRVNCGFEDLLGWNNDDFKALSMLELCYPDPEERQSAIRAFTSTDSQWHDVRARAKDGTKIDVSWSAVALTDQRRLAIGIDVRERKKALTQLHQQEAQLRTNLAQVEGIYANAPVALCVLDRDLRFVQANALVGAVNRVDASELIGRSVHEVVPDLGLQVEAFVNRILDNGKPLIDYEICGKTPDRPGDDRIWVQSGWPLKDTSGNVVAVNIAAREVTDARRMERRLAESEARFRNMAETVPDVLFTADAEGRVDFVTSLYYELTGASDGAALGTAWLDNLHPDDCVRVSALWEAAVRACSSVSMKYRLRMRDGSYRWMESRARPVMDEASAKIKWYGTASDVDDLVRAQQALESADQQKDEFLAILGHELRNPMAPVRSAVDLMHCIAPDDPQLRGAIAMVDRQSQHMERLLDDLLDVSRIVRGKLKLSKRVCALDDVIEQAIDMARPLIDERRHEFDCQMPAERIHLRADPVRLAQVFVNLLNNAAKYTPEGGRVRLQVETRGQRVAVRVIDNGEGIDPALMDDMFEAFIQGRRLLNRAPGGLGLGLAIAARLSQMHGGSIEAFSEGPGRGTELVVELPLTDERPPAAEIRRSCDDSQAPKPKVLVVDDSQDVADSMASLLRALKYETQVAFSGPEAIEAVGRFQPRVVLLDIGMEEMDGFETARRLREIEPSPARMLLVALSGYGDAGTQARGREAGLDLHLTKPVGRQVLSEVLESLDRGGVS